jgi:hypothetical protein
MEKDNSITGVLGFKPSVAAILAYMAQNQTTDHPSSEVAAATGVGKSTARTVLSQLADLGVVRVARTFSKMNFYVIDADNRIAFLLMELFKEASGRCACDATGEPGVEGPSGIPAEETF